MFHSQPTPGSHDAGRISHPNQALNALLMRLGSTIRDLCQRQIDKHRSLDNIDLSSIIDRVLRDHGAEADFDQQLIACINAMCQNDAAGQTLAFLRDDAKLQMRHINTLDLLGPGLDRYEIVLFDGGNGHGDRWKHVFFPTQRMHYFVYEDL